MWAHWEPVHKPAPCDAAAETEYDGYCFVINPAVDDAIEAYSALGAPATAIVYGTPPWARGERPCSPAHPGFEWFCVHDDDADYARFAGMLAHRYNGANGHGRVSDFVIQNEVNHNVWFDVGCGDGIPCTKAEWVATYAGAYNAAYDAIRAEQPVAPVLISYEHHFAPELDNLLVPFPVLSVMTFTEALAPLLGDREWAIAIHPYSSAVGFTSTFTPFDLPYVTFGNLGVLQGWLRATFPDDPHSWVAQITEVGIHNAGNTDARQVRLLCDAFRNVMGTPDMTSFIYHRLRDHPDEMGLKLGLRHEDGSPKPAFFTWHDANDPANPSCGFEHGRRTMVRHGVDDATGKHVFSSRVLPEGYVDQGDAWLLEREELPGTAPLLECGDGESMSYLSRDPGCEGDTPLGPVGFIATATGPGLVPLVRCTGDAGHVASVTPACAAADQIVLGFVADPDPPATTTTTTTTTATSATSTTTSAPVGSPPPPGGTATAVPASAVTARPAFTG